MSFSTYVKASLPDLHLDQEPEITFDDVVFRLYNYMPASFLEEVKVVRRLIDLNNIRALFYNDAFDQRGNLTETELESALEHQTILPDYVFDFLDTYTSNEKRVKNIGKIFVRYFQIEGDRARGFLKEYLQFEREVRLLTTAYTGKKLGFDLDRQFQFEETSDDFVHFILSQKDREGIVFPLEYRDLEEIFATSQTPIERHQRFNRFKFHRFEELYIRRQFSKQALLFYFIQFLIVDSYYRLDEKVGKGVIESIGRYE